MKMPEIKIPPIPDRVRNIRKCLGRIFDVLYLAFFCVLVVWSFLGTVQLEIPWNAWVQAGIIQEFLIVNFLFRPQTVLALIVWGRYLFSCTFERKKYIIAFLAFLCVWNRNETVCTYVLLALGACELNFRKLMRCYTALVGGLCAATILGSQCGLVENLVYDIAGRGTRVAYGFMYPTIFASHLFFLMLCIWYCLKDKWNWCLAVVCMLMAVWVYKGANARFSAICFLLFGFVLLCCGMRKYVKPPLRKTLYRKAGWALAEVPLMCALGIHVLSIWYDSGSAWMNKLNGLLSSRLFLGQKGIQVYGFSTWGKSIPMIGFGGDVVLPSRYFYLDSFYVQASLIYGLVALVVILFLALLAGYQAVRYGEWKLLWILAFVGLHGVIEDLWLSVSVCPFLFAAFADFGPKPLSEKKLAGADRKVLLTGAFLLAITIGILCGSQAVSAYNDGAAAAKTEETKRKVTVDKYETPDEVAEYVIYQIHQGNLELALRGCAVQSVAENFSVENYALVTGELPYMDLLPPADLDDPVCIQISHARLIPDYMERLEQCQELFGKEHDVKILSISSEIPEEMDGRYYKKVRQISSILGARTLQDVRVNMEVDGSVYQLTLTAVRYRSQWEILQFSGYDHYLYTKPEFEPIQGAVEETELPIPWEEMEDQVLDLNYFIADNKKEENIEDTVWKFFLYLQRGDVKRALGYYDLYDSQEELEESSLPYIKQQEAAYELQQFYYNLLLNDQDSLNYIMQNVRDEVENFVVQLDSAEMIYVNLGSIEVIEADAEKATCQIWYNYDGGGYTRYVSLVYRDGWKISGIRAE